MDKFLLVGPTKHGNWIKEILLSDFPYRYKVNSRYWGAIKFKVIQEGALYLYFRSKDKILFTNLPISYPGMLTEVKDLDVKKLIMDKGEVECSPELIPEVDDE